MDLRLAPLFPADPAVNQLAARDPELRAIVSHLGVELARPLGSLREGFDRMLNQGAVTPEQRGHLRTMVGLCEDLHRLIRGYEQYADLVLGTGSPRVGAMPMGGLVRAWNRHFATAAAARHLAWSCTLDGPETVATIDAAGVDQVIRLLVDNALKFTPAGGMIRVSARVEGSRWLVTVADDGPGIPAEAQSRVFEPFVRLPRDERADIEGLGLGLAICRELVDQMKGEIALTSNPGQGTRVTVNLPVASPRPEPLKPRSKRPPAGS